MKILFVIDSMGASGAEHSTAALLPRLRSDGHDVAVATLYDAGFGDEERLRTDSFEIVPLTSRRFLGRVRELRRRIKAYGPDVVHTALFDADMVGRVAACRAGPVVVSSLVNTPYESVRLEDPGVTRWKLKIAEGLDAFTIRLMVDRLHAVSAGVATVECPGPAGRPGPDHRRASRTIS